MAAVRIEEEAFSDPRYIVLANACQLADPDHARGKMAVLWRQCTALHSYVLPLSIIRAVLGEKGEAALVESQLGEAVDGGIRMRGTKGRIEWLKKLRKNAKKGGEAKAAKRQGGGKQEAAKALPEVFPSALALASASSPAQTDSERDSATPSAGGLVGLESAIQRNLGDVGLARSRKKPRPSDPTDAEIAIARRVLDKLGSYNGVEYRYSDAHVKLIVNQLRSEVTEQELRIVVGYCCFGLEWKDDPKMHRHLCPETLFGPKTISKYLDPGRAWFKTIDDTNASAQGAPQESRIAVDPYAGPEWQEPAWMLSGGAA